MVPAPDDSPPPGRLRRRLAWRLGTPITFLLCGTLFVVSAASSDGTDLRPGRYTELSSVVSNESEEAERLQRQLARLNEDIDRLSAQINDEEVQDTQNRMHALEGPSGLRAVSGSGVTVQLADAPASVMDSSDENINLLVVHQQDIQAVVNAMWRGGAEAVTIQGQRVISTTGIKCSGNAIRLHGIPYPQPYVISAVGDQSRLYDSIMADEDLQSYRDQAAIPDVAIGWDFEFDNEITAPAYEGLLDLSYAKPAT